MSDSSILHEASDGDQHTSASIKVSLRAQHHLCYHWGAAVWVLTGGNGRDVADIDVLVSADVDVRNLRKDLVAQCPDGWYGMAGLNLFGGMTDTDSSGILIISLLTNSI